MGACDRPDVCDPSAAQHLPLPVTQILGRDEPGSAADRSPEHDVQGGAPTAATEAEASERFDEFTVKWGPRYPAITRLWHSAWSEFVPFLDYDPEIRRVICSTDVIVKGSAGFGGFRFVEDGDAGMCSSRVIVSRSQGWPAGHRGADCLDAGRDHPRLGGAEHRSRRCRCALASGAATRR